MFLLLLAFSQAGFAQVPEEAKKHAVWGETALKMANDVDGYKKAAEEFETSAKLAPHWPVPYYNLGIIYAKSDDYDNALKSYKKYLKLAPEAPDASAVKKQIYALEYKKNRLKSEMALIPAGYFMMGSPKGVGKKEEHPQHKVWVDAFYIDKTEVTFDQYDNFGRATGRVKPSDEGWGRGTRPVVNINWNDADAYCKWAGKRLPTEAEWEKAARGGTDTKWYWGDDENVIDEYAWYDKNSGGTTHPVGLKKPNPFGLFDMAGNVWEWCSDWYGEKYYQSSLERNPGGPDSGEYRILRGGSWGSNADYAYSAYRSGCEPYGRTYRIGCRCARKP
jgi:formylglycine-generating enzyme required for sulfatase activity